MYLALQRHGLREAPLNDSRLGKPSARGWTQIPQVSSVRATRDVIHYWTPRRIALRAILPEDYTFRYSHGSADSGRQRHNLFHCMRVLGSSFVPSNPLLRCPGLGDASVGQRPGPKPHVRHWSITLGCMVCVAGSMA